MENPKPNAMGKAHTAHPWLCFCTALVLGSLAAALPVSLSRDLVLATPEALAAKGEGKGGGRGEGKGGRGGEGSHGGKGESGGHGGPSGGSPSGGKQSRASAAADGTIEVRHANGISETVKGDIYTMRDARGRQIISRPARPADRRRLDDYLH